MAVPSRIVVWFVRVALFVGILFSAPSARADGFMTGAPPGKVEWKDGQWDRFTPAEFALTSMILVGSFTLDARLHNNPTPGWEFEVPVLDPGARGLFRARTGQYQAVWAGWSDIGYRTMALFPQVVDAGIVALGIHHNPDVAAQLFLIDTESFTLAALAQQLSSRFARRPRPFVQDCADDNHSARYECGDLRDVRSFYAGHASAAFTAAGLTCLHHQHIPLYGGGAPDAWACLWALSFASFTAFGRVASDEHYASDTLVGIGTGLFFGYLMPEWLHYGTSSSKPKSIIGRLLMPTPSRDGGIVMAPSFESTADGGGILGIRGTL